MALHEVEGGQIAVAVAHEDHLLKRNVPLLFRNVPVHVSGPVRLDGIQSLGDREEVAHLVVMAHDALRSHDLTGIFECPMSADDRVEARGDRCGGGNVDEPGRDEIELDLEIVFDVADGSGDPIEHLGHTRVQLELCGDLLERLVGYRPVWSL